MTNRLILALAPAALALATFAHAQPAGPPPGGGGGPPRAELEARRDAMRAQHLDDLRTVLRLRPDQEPALAAFIEAHKSEPRDFDGPREPRVLTTPQRVDDMAKREAEMSARHKRLSDGLTTFYAALSPEQQKVFDALERLKGPPGGPGGLGGPGGRMMGPPPGAPDQGPGPIPLREPPR